MKINIVIDLILLFLIIFNYLILLDFQIIHKIVFLILLYLLGSFILLYLDNYYLGLTYIIIYVGAIAILFLFIIMIFNINTIKNSKKNELSKFVIILMGLI